MLRHFFPLLAFGALACVSTTPEPTNAPSEDAPLSLWEEAQEICGPLLEKGQEAILTGGSAVTGFEARAPYDSCMEHQGWAGRAEVDETRALGMQQEVNQFLDEEILPRQTRADFEPAFGAPHCHSAVAEAEICVWEFEYRSEVAAQSYPVVLTCILPGDGSPRGDASCLLDAR